MVNVPLKFKQRDIERAVRACRASGIDPVAVEVDPHSGRIKVVGGGKTVSTTSGSDLDQWVSKHAGTVEGA